MTQDFIISNAVSLRDEMLAYETLWGLPDQTTKRLSELFGRHNHVVPSHLLRLVEQDELFPPHADLRKEVEAFLEPLRGFTVAVHGAFQYPEGLRDARHPIQVFYYRGDIGLTETACVSIVGSRKASEAGLARAGKMARLLVERGYTIVSGLAKGVDTAAMTTAIATDGKTIGVIGTPINQSYPKENRALQERVATEHLLISHVPFFRYEHEPFRFRRRYFPERNAVMAALSEATIIIEASDTSGTLTQARAALHQGRKLMILNSCFENPDISWPKTYEARGAIRIHEIDDVLPHLSAPSSKE